MQLFGRKGDVPSRRHHTGVVPSLTAFTQATATYELFDCAGAFMGSGAVVDGVCDPTPMCNDGYRTGDEDGVDCGGSCPDACPACDDGVQNGYELGCAHPNRRAQLTRPAAAPD